jgi:hypothetical protein
MIDHDVEGGRLDTVRQAVPSDTPFTQRKIVCEDFDAVLREVGEWGGCAAASRRQDAILNQEERDLVALSNQAGGQPVEVRDIEPGII